MGKLKGKTQEVIKYFKSHDYDLKITSKHFGCKFEQVSRVISKHMLKKANQMTGTYKK